jgi:hypothetical protein
VYGHEIDGECDRAAALLDKVFAAVIGHINVAKRKLAENLTA